jgi:hypothetical protein
MGRNGDRRMDALERAVVHRSRTPLWRGAKKGKAYDAWKSEHEEFLSRLSDYGSRAEGDCRNNFLDSLLDRLAKKITWRKSRSW